MVERSSAPYRILSHGKNEMDRGEDLYKMELGVVAIVAAAVVVRCCCYILSYMCDIKGNLHKIL